MSKNFSLESLNFGLESLLKRMPGTLYWKGRDQKYLGCNENLAGILGLGSPGEIFGKDEFDLISDRELAQVTMENCELVMQSATTMEFEENGFNILGEPTKYLSRKEPLFDTEGKVVGLIGVSLDVREYRKGLWKKFEKKAKAREDRVLKQLGRYIEGEFYAPLRDIRLSLIGVRSNLKDLLIEYGKLKQAGLLPEGIPDDIDSSNLVKAFQDNERGIGYCFNFLQILSGNLGVGKVTAEGCYCQLIEETVRYAISGYSYLSPEEHEKIVYERLKIDFIYYGEAELLTLVIQNLIKNALYSIREEEDGKVFIELRRGERGDCMNYISVRDNGIGVPPDLQSKIFDRFFTTKSGASGLGLTFCKKVMETFKGEIVLVKDKNGDLTEFLLRFPKRGVTE